MGININSQLLINVTAKKLLLILEMYGIEKIKFKQKNRYIYIY